MRYPLRHRHFLRRFPRLIWRLRHFRLWQVCVRKFTFTCCVYGGTFAEAIRSSLLLQGERGVSFISSHATMDAEHMAELRQVLNTVTDEAAREAIVESTLVNFHLVTRVFEAV